MTTAHRPTFNPAKGGGSEYGYWSSGGAVSHAFSSLDLPAHTKLKYRQIGQATQAEVQEKDLRAELEHKEHEAGKKGLVAIANIEEEEKKVNVPLLLTNRPEIDEQKLATYDDKDDDNDFGSSEDDSDDDDDDDDDEAEIQRELERIKREKEEARRKEEEERLVAEEQAKQDSAIQGNPLMNLGSGAGSAKIKRRWNDDVIFRNQAKAEPEIKKRFMNDTIRNDFHKRFLDKYMK